MTNMMVVIAITVVMQIIADYHAFDDHGGDSRHGFVADDGVCDDLNCH